MARGAEGAIKTQSSLTSDSCRVKIGAHLALSDHLAEANAEAYADFGRTKYLYPPTEISIFARELSGDQIFAFTGPASRRYIDDLSFGKPAQICKYWTYVFALALGNTHFELLKEAVRRIQARCFLSLPEFIFSPSHCRSQPSASH